MPSMRNRRIYVMRLRDNWRTSGCVAPSSPCIPPLSACRVSVHLHALCDRPASSSRASSRDHCWHSLCLRLPFAVIWLGPDLPRGSQISTLDRVLSFGTLAKRTGKQPGMPGAQRDRTSPRGEAPPPHRAYGSRTRRVGWCKSEERPEHSPNRAFRSLMLCAHVAHTGKGPDSRNPTDHYHLATPFGAARLSGLRRSRTMRDLSN